DVIDTAPGASDDLELSGVFEDLRRDLAGASYDQRVGLLQSGSELIGGHLGMHLDRPSWLFLQRVQAGFGNSVSHQNPRHGIRIPRSRSFGMQQGRLPFLRN